MSQVFIILRHWKPQTMESCSHYEFSLFPLALGNWEPETKKVGFVIYSIDTAYNQSLGHFPTSNFFLLVLLISYDIFDQKFLS